MSAETQAVAIVTGASKGIGRAIALKLAATGYRVVCAARQSEPLDAMVAEMRQSGYQALAVSCDVMDSQARQVLLDRTLTHFGRLDVLVNNAGGGGPNNAMTLSAEAFTRIFEFNVTSAYALIQLCAPHMRNGVIINITSAAARYSQPGFTAYGTAKAALTQLTKLLAAELAPHIRVNAVAPGPVMTDALKRAAPEGLLETMARNTPLARLGNTDDIASAVLYLAGESGNWITGKVLELDGGAEQSVWPG
ncbi:oxidoreductase [Shewanella sp. NFH-SH190041]|uniref:SDR family NAD(P)-dependent oxidoreductase n=1 Tax=Shewanella sp. NFH-SH190041 TaxID=2950245 RepID=UPI0021C2E05E|nr:glucose 1-dehydrogenase [Shewanella sp. NFH-SH190041]BDM64987.1 oxidoreductase [Shewanella sp. NFH-SH190041]